LVELLEAARLPMSSSQPPSDQSKGQIEAAVTEAITQFEREYLGRGPKEAKSFIVENLVVVKLQGILGPAERRLSHEDGGVELIKKMRRRVIESCSGDLSGLVREQTGIEVVSMHSDISARTGERVFVFTLEDDLEAALENR
jgi:uncharacterized protein YbcI